MANEVLTKPPWLCECTPVVALDFLLDPANPGITLQTLQRAALAVGRNLRLKLLLSLVQSILAYTKKSTMPVFCYNVGMDSDSEMPVSPDKSGRERSGRARMSRLSAEERSELAKMAAEKRWGQKESDPAVLIYQSDDQKTRIDVRVEDETVWLSQAQMAHLFQVSRPNVTLHVRNIFDEGELDPQSVSKEYLQTAADGKNYQTKMYNLDVIISVGYRVKSNRGTQFRIWATQRLREYIVKGFSLDDERLKKGGTHNDYFDELLQRVREIRTSERNFWRKITDVYATSIDYDANSPISHNFFATVQNKFHFAIHGHTAAELIMKRANANLPHMGLTSWDGPSVRKADVSNAKNYLNKDELESLNLLVDQYLSFAELQARQRRAMHMLDWTRKLDDFLRLNDRDILNSAGKVSAKLGKDMAEKEYDRYSAKEKSITDAKVSDFEKYVRRIQGERS
jgi:hypothetical protein